MTGKELYRIWAPTGVKWVDWVRPVPFVALQACSKPYYIPEMRQPGAVQNQAQDNHAVVKQNEDTRFDTIFIVDLPGGESVKKGIELAREGYRPIPIFNGTVEQQGARATTDNQSVVMALYQGAAQLKEIALQEDAPPAFLLDSNRLNRFKMDVALFDNSWDVYPQDLPSADYLVGSGIRRIVVVGERLSGDLKKLLYSFQRKGIEICFTNGYEEPKRIRIRKSLRRKKD